MLYKAGSYMLSGLGGGDMQGILDCKHILQIPTHKTIFTRFLWCLAFRSILAVGEMFKQL